MGRYSARDGPTGDGSEEITATTGQQIAVVEVNADKQAMAGGVAKVTANAGG